MFKTNLSTKNHITPAQCKAARNLLNWNQQDLAKKSRVSLATIGAFEAGTRTPYLKTLEDIVEAFEQAGMELEDNDKFCLIKLNK